MDDTILVTVVDSRGNEGVARVSDDITVQQDHLGEGHGSDFSEFFVGEHDSRLIPPETVTISHSDVLISDDGLEGRSEVRARDVEFGKTSSVEIDVVDTVGTIGLDQDVLDGGIRVDLGELSVGGQSIGNSDGVEVGDTVISTSSKVSADQIGTSSTRLSVKEVSQGRNNLGIDGLLSLNGHTSEEGGYTQFRPSVVEEDVFHQSVTLRNNVSAFIESVKDFISFRVSVSEGSSREGNLDGRISVGVVSSVRRNNSRSNDQGEVLGFSDTLEFSCRPFSAEFVVLGIVQARESGLEFSDQSVVLSQHESVVGNDTRVFVSSDVTKEPQGSISDLLGSIVHGKALFVSGWHFKAAVDSRDNGGVHETSSGSLEGISSSNINTIDDRHVEEGSNGIGVLSNTVGIELVDRSNKGHGHSSSSSGIKEGVSLRHGKRSRVRTVGVGQINVVVDHLTPEGKHVGVTLRVEATIRSVDAEDGQRNGSDISAGNERALSIGETDGEFSSL